MVWELRRDPDADPLDETGMIVEWTQIGQRTRESAAPATNLETRTTIEDAYERVVVFGRSKGLKVRRSHSLPGVRSRRSATSGWCLIRAHLRPGH